MVRFTCPTCHSTSPAADEKVGAAVVCPICKSEAPIPAPSPVAQWYYSRDGKSQGPVTNAGLKHLADSGHLQPADLLWKDGMAKWRPASDVKGLFAATREAVAPPLAVVSTPPAPAEEVQWHYARNGERFGPVSAAQLTALLVAGQLQRSDWVWNLGIGQWVAAGSVKEFSVEKVESASDGPEKDVSAAKPAGPRGFFGNLAQQALKNVQEAGTKIKDAAQSKLAPDKPLAASEGLVTTPPGPPPLRGQVKPPILETAPGSSGPIPPPVELAADDPAKDLPAAKPAGPRGFFGNLAQQALKNVQEAGTKIKDAAQSKLAPDKPPASAGLVTPPPGPPPLRGQQIELPPVQEAVPETSAPIPPPGVVQTTTIAEVTATYQGGHPEFVDKSRGLLRLDDVGLEFAYKDSEKKLRITYDQLSNILEPQKGGFPEEMVNTANHRQTASSAVSGFLGLAAKLSGDHRLKMAASVGKTVASTVKNVSKLGPPPKNRLSALVFVGGVKHKLGFDVVAESTARMEEAATGFWNRSAQVRGRFAKTGGAFSPGDALEQLKGLLDQGILTQEQFDQRSTVTGRAAGPASDGQDPSSLFSSFSSGTSQQLLRILKQLKALTDQEVFTTPEFEELKAIILPKLQAGKTRSRGARRAESDSPTGDPDDDIERGCDFDDDGAAFDNDDEDCQQAEADEEDNVDEGVEEEASAEADEEDDVDEGVEEEASADDHEDYSPSSDADDD